MYLLRKYRVEILIFTLAACLFFFLRLYNLGSLPLFTDEAIYTRWSQIAKQDAAWRFISLTDGKQPLFVWLDMIFMRFIKDPLMAGRIVSVFTGVLSAVGLYFLGKEVFKNKAVGFISSFLYIIYPFALVYDRMALYDSLVGAFAVWMLYLEVLLIRRIRLDIALILALILGGAVLTKTSGFFGIYLLPFSLILFNLKEKEKKILFLKWAGLAVVAVVLAYSYYSILRLSPFFHLISEKNATFVYPLAEWTEHPFRFLHGNLAGLWDWFLTYTSIPIIGLMIFSLLTFRSFLKEKILLIIWFIVPLFALALFGKVLYPRFILFMTLPLLPLAAVSLFQLSKLIKNKAFFVLSCLLLTVFLLRSDYLILTDFGSSPIPDSDKGQYINGWPAGGGLRELVGFLEDQSKKGKIYVASEGTFGSLPTVGIEIYLDNNKNIEKRGIWPIPHEIPKDLAETSKKMPTFFIFNNTQEKPLGWPLKFISKYQKGISEKYYLSIYQVESK